MITRLRFLPLAIALGAALSGCGAGIGLADSLVFTQPPPSVVRVGESITFSFAIGGTLTARLSQLRYSVSCPEEGVVTSGSLAPDARSFTWAVRNQLSSRQCTASVFALAKEGNETTLSSIIRVVTSSSTLAGFRFGFGASAGTAQTGRMTALTGLAYDGSAYLYVADATLIWRVSLFDGSMDLFAGRPNVELGSNSTDDRTDIMRAGQVAYLNGYVYYADWRGHTIRKISADPNTSDYKVIQLVAGTSGSSGSQDGVGSAARFNVPYGITTDGTKLFVADQSNHTIRTVDPSTGTVATLSGLAGAAGLVNGAAAVARFNTPRSITYASGSLYIMEGSRRIRQVDAASGTASTFSGSGVSGCVDGTSASASYGSTAGLTSNGSVLYVTDPICHTIRTVSLATGTSTLLAGAPFSNGYAQGNALVSARFTQPSQALQVGNTLYITEERSSSVRAMDLTSTTVTAFAGGLADPAIDTNKGFWGGNNASVEAARGIHTNDGNRIFFTDYRAHTVRELNVSLNSITTVSGLSGQNGNATGTGTVARYSQPHGIAKLGALVYIVDRLNNCIKSMDATSYAVSVFAGSTTAASGTSNGVGTAARFNSPYGLVTDGTNLFVSDRGNHCIRQITPAGNVTTLAGTCGTSGTADGVGAAAAFSSPDGIAISSDLSTLYIGDTGNSVIRKIVIATASVTTLAGTLGVAGSSDGVGLSASFSSPICLHALGTSLFVLENGGLLRQVDLTSNSVTTLMGASGLANAASFADAPVAGATCSGGAGLSGFGAMLYMSCENGMPLRVLDTSSWMVKALAGKGSQDLSSGIWGARDGNPLSTVNLYQSDVVYDGNYIYSADEGNAVIVRLNKDGSGRIAIAGSFGVAGTTDGAGSAARLTRVAGMALVGRKIYFGQPDAGTIRTLDLNNLNVATIAGTANSFGSTDGTGASARFYQIQDIVADSDALYIVERGNQLVRRLSLASADYGRVQTWAGTAGISGSTDGVGSAAKFSTPSGITLLGNYLYVADKNNHLLRRIDKTTQEVTTFAGTVGVAGSVAGTGVNAQFTAPGAITNDGTNLFMRASAVVWRIDPTTAAASLFLGVTDRDTQLADTSADSLNISSRSGIKFFTDLGFLMSSRGGITRID